MGGVSMNGKRAKHSRSTVGDFGRSMGLSEEDIVDVLCEALRRAGPGTPHGKFVGLLHPVADDRSTTIALELRREAGSRRARHA